MRKTRVIALGVCALVAAACGGSTPSSSSSPASKVTVHVGIIPSPLVPPLLLGLDHGFFAAEGLQLDVKNVDAGQTAVSAVAQGSLDIAAVGPEPALAAASNNVPIRGFAGSYVTGSGVLGATSIPVPGDSSVKTLLDLTGKKVAVNMLNSTVAVCLKAAVDSAGGDWKKLNIVEMPFPTVVPSLQRRQVDAAVLVEPFSLQAKQAGMRSIGDACEAAYPSNSPMGVWIASDKTVKTNRSLIDRFRRALSKAYDYTNSHVAEEKSSMMRVLSGLSAADLALMQLTPYDITMDRAIWTTRVDILVRYQVLTKRPDLSTFIVQ